MQGAKIGVLGRNGAGKTTIMKMLTGYIEPSGGVVTVDGTNVQDDPLAVQAQMGYLPESLPLYPEMTVADYLAHAAAMRALDPQTCVAEAIRATQLEEKAFDRIDTLSRGYKQRLGVAQAILHKPKFLILDEPSNGLDPNQIREMRALILRLAEHATVILSTHIMQEVNAVCDRALILRSGRLVVDEKLTALQQSAHVRLRTAPQADVAGALTDCEGAANPTELEQGVWQLELGSEVDATIARIARALTAHEVPIYQLNAETRDLETIFAEVNESTVVATGEEQDAA